MMVVSRMSPFFFDEDRSTSVHIYLLAIMPEDAFTGLLESGTNNDAASLRMSWLRVEIIITK